MTDKTAEIKKKIDAAELLYRERMSEPEYSTLEEAILAAYDLLDQNKALTARSEKAITILQTVDWVGSEAKGRIEDAIGILAGEDNP